MRSVLVILIWCLAVLFAGCVERELTITSEPSGALVYVSDVEVGRTPVKIPFTWYGDYEVILRLEGYETLKTHADIKAPLYDIPPWDLVSQAMVPWTYHYYVNKHYALQRQVLPDDQALYERAVELRQENLQPVQR